MRFEIDDKQLLLVSGVACASYAAHALTAPRHFHELYMEKVQKRSIRPKRIAQNLVSLSDTRY